MGIKELLSRSMKKDEDFSKAQKELKIKTILEQRQKSANERELESRVEKDRQRHINLELERRRKKDNEDMWNSNIFKNNKNIMKQKNIFVHEKQKHSNLFFKSQVVKRK